MLKIWKYLLLVLLIIRGSWQICDRRPLGAPNERSAVDENFQVIIEGNPTTYIPGQRYNVTLLCDDALKFISFTLVVENDPTSLSESDEVGYFELIDTTDTRFSSRCENMIESTNMNAKIRISVGWVAPAINCSCLLIRAAVLQHRNVWFIDDGFLTKRICPEEIDDVNKQTPPVDPCCACDEAKYELIVERKWGCNTHPKDFPVEERRTRFSEVIGASHTKEYNFWQYGESASRGLRELAEHGATRELEMEIKYGDIRTMIKAPGIKFRKNIISTTLANVRVDPQHHVISLVSKIEPSPDWVLGVAGLELCLANCTWINEKVLNLYPWDIGTDAGPSYMSPDQAQVPPDVVRRITSTSPNDERSPFYEKSGAPMKPLATLYVKRKKLYERECESAEIIPLECSTHPWNTWSECTTRCGPGTQFRTRAYKDPALAAAASSKCQVVLRQTRKCVGEQCGAPQEELEAGKAGTCELTPWSAWTPCSRRCGRGVSIRRRDYTNPYEREKCLNEKPVKLKQRKSCEGIDCDGGRQTQNRYEEETERDNENLDEQEFESNEGNDDPNEAEEAAEENDGNQLPEPEQFGQRRPDFSASLPDSRYFGRQPDVSINQNFDQPAVEEEENEQSDPIDDIPDEQNRYRGGMTRYNQRNDDFDEDNNYGIRAEYDENGHKAIYAESSDPSDYNVVQQYCFQMPHMWRSPCYRKILGVRNYWFYDASDRQCKLFTTDDCDDNKNKFRSLEACEGTCLLPHNNQESMQDVEEDNEWTRQFGQPESLVKKPRRKERRRNRKRKQNEGVVGNIRYY
ncbi:spondin-1 [Anastrepha ludens]|uniref:spondin-1 n=1 Tax=Anastrepha ludens TaxID=28586 RepID=UPI0023AFDBC1|nr:spondin-1 [Anastrepha ludens]